MDVAWYTLILTVLTIVLVRRIRRGRQVFEEQFLDHVPPPEKPLPSLPTVRNRLRIMLGFAVMTGALFAFSVMELILISQYLIDAQALLVFAYVTVALWSVILWTGALCTRYSIGDFFSPHRGAYEHAGIDGFLSGMLLATLLSFMAIHPAPELQLLAGCVTGVGVIILLFPNIGFPVNHTYVSS